MRSPILVLAAALVTSHAAAESATGQFNDAGYGTFSGRIQSLGMYRDYDNGNNNHATTLGLQLDYRSPKYEGWTAGASYVGAGVIDSMIDDERNPGDRLLGNGRVNVLNEAYLSYNMETLGWADTTATLGRRVNNGEVFRADDFRQKKRAIEAVMLESGELNKTRILVGHAREMSNWIDAGNLWKFDNFDNWDTDGITWGELVYHGMYGLEVALFDAYASDVANLLGVRAKLDLSEDTAILGYLRTEHDVGRNSGHDANAIGLSITQQVGKVKLEGGYFGVSADSLEFQEVTTGINHALGSSMMIYSGQFSGGADTAYLKAVTKLENTRTTLYCLYNYTLHDEGKIDLRQAQELNIVIKQPVPKIDNLAVAFKGGIGTRDGVSGDPDTTATDTRLYVTYTF